MIDKYLQSAVIGFWRSGATVEQIYFVTKIKPYIVEYIINSYIKK